MNEIADRLKRHLSVYLVINPKKILLLFSFFLSSVFNLFKKENGAMREH